MDPDMGLSDSMGWDSTIASGGRAGQAQQGISLQP